MERVSVGQRLLWAALGVGCGVFLLGASVGSAARPGEQSDPTATPDIPAVSECTVEPVDVSSLMGLTSGSGADASDLLTAEPVSEDELPEGVPAVEEEIEGITATVREMVACANAGDPLRIVALITPEYQASLAAMVLTATPEQAEQLLVRFPVPLASVDTSSPIEMIPIRDVRLLDDGRVGAILEPTVPGTDEVRVGFFIVFELVKDRWLIDDVVLLDIGLLATPAATPGATPAGSHEGN